MRAGDFVGAKIYRKPTEDKRTKKDGTPRSPKKPVSYTHLTLPTIA